MVIVHTNLGLRNQITMSKPSSSLLHSKIDHLHRLLAVAAKKACLTKLDALTKLPLVQPNLDDTLFETDSESEPEPDTSDWEDVIPPSNSPKADEKISFQRVDSKRDLASSKSLLTAMLSGSIPVAPVEIGWKHQVGKQKARYRSPEQKTLSPRSTRRKMLSAELSVSLRHHLLSERQQKQRVPLMQPLKWQARGNEVTNVRVKAERSNSF